jgi:hypothetical protein
MKVYGQSGAAPSRINYLREFATGDFVYSSDVDTPDIFHGALLTVLIGDSTRDGFYVSRLQNILHDEDEWKKLRDAFEDIRDIVKGW